MVKIVLILMFLVILFGAPKFGGCQRGVVLTIPNGLSQTKRYTESVDELVERYYRERDFEKALTYEEQAILEMKYGSMDTDTFCRLNAMLGGCYVSLGECEKGKPYIDTALKEYEESGETGKSVYIVRHIEGIYALKTGEYRTAIDSFEEALRQAEALQIFLEEPAVPGGVDAGENLRHVPGREDLREVAGVEDHAYVAPHSGVRVVPAQDFHGSAVLFQLV